MRVGRSERRCLDSGDVEARSGQGDLDVAFQRAFTIVAGEGLGMGGPVMPSAQDRPHLLAPLGSQGASLCVPQRHWSYVSSGCEFRPSGPSGEAVAASSDRG